MLWSLCDTAADAAAAVAADAATNATTCSTYSCSLSGLGFWSYSPLALVSPNQTRIYGFFTGHWPGALPVS